jgi:hypothetical protein
MVLFGCAMRENDLKNRSRHKKRAEKISALGFMMVK